MLLVDPPTRNNLLEIINALQNNKISREEVVTWQRAVVNQFGDTISLSAADGYWYFHSFAFMDVPIVDRDGSGFFIRRSDLDEYALDIQQVPAAEFYGDVLRRRSHEVDNSALRWPLTTFRYDACPHLAEMPSVRGTFEARGDMVEHTHLEFEESVYLIVRQFDEYANQGMLLGTDRDPEKLAEFMAQLEIEPFFF